jgi:hypothetical protein
MKKFFRKTKQKIRHSLTEHPPTTIIVDKAEALFLRSEVRAEPDFEYRAHSQFTGEPASSETDVSAGPNLYSAFQV